AEGVRDEFAPGSASLLSEDLPIQHRIARLHGHRSILCPTLVQTRSWTPLVRVPPQNLVRFLPSLASRRGRAHVIGPGGLMTADSASTNLWIRDRHIQIHSALNAHSAPRQAKLRSLSSGVHCNCEGAAPSRDSLGPACLGIALPSCSRPTARMLVPSRLLTQ